MVNGLVEVVAKREGGERGRERRNRFVEAIPKRQCGERGG